MNSTRRPEHGAEQVDMGSLIAAISQRVNPGGVKEVTIRQYGSEQVEIIIPAGGRC